MLALMLPLLSSAWADTPLIHDGPPEVAVARAVALGAGPAWELDPLRPEQLLPTPHAGLVGITSSCQRAPSSAVDLRKSVEFAEAMYSRQKWDATRRHIDEAKAKLPCLTDEADAVRLAHLHLMDGIVAHEQGRTADVQRAFDLAQRFGTDLSTGQLLAWDHRLASPDRGEPALKRAGDALLQARTGTLRLAPGVDTGRLTLRIDGRTVPVGQDATLSLPVGYHHIQVISTSVSGRLVRTYTVDLTEDEPILVADPGGLAGLSLGPHVDTPALTDFIRAAGIQGTTWVVAGDQTWTLDTQWTRLPELDLAAREAAALRATRMRAAGIASLATGAVVGGVGMWGLFHANTAPPSESTPTDIAWRNRQYNAWIGVEAVGLGSMATGAFLLWRGQAVE